MSQDAPAHPPEPVVAFDEAGNTGEDLMNRDQLIFVLASVHLNEDVAGDLVRRATMPRASEVHFKRMRKTTHGRRLLLELLRSEALTEHTVRVVRYHKRFMVTTKIVDMLVETMAHNHGVDLYARGANLGLANLWHHVMPTFCGKALFDALQHAFVAMVRNRSGKTEGAFYDVVARMHDASASDEFRQDLMVLMATRAVLDEGIRDGAHNLDPAIPAFVELASVWTGLFTTPFVILHDPSVPMLSQRESLELLMSTTEPTRIIGTDRRTGAFPIRAGGVHLETVSHESAQLQVADTVAGAVAYVLNTRAHGRADPFADELLDTRLSEVYVGGVWPSLAVTPEDLGTEGTEGVNAVDAVAEHIARRRRGR